VSYDREEGLSDDEASERAFAFLTHHGRMFGHLYRPDPTKPWAPLMAGPKADARPVLLLTRWGYA
jgi:hypothetical protein